MTKTPENSSVERLSECLARSAEGAISFKPTALKSFCKDALALERGQELFKVLSMMLQFSVVLKRQNNSEPAFKALQHEVMPLVERLGALAAAEGGKLDGKVKALAKDLVKMTSAESDSDVPKSVKKALAPKSGGVSMRGRKAKR